MAKVKRGGTDPIKTLDDLHDTARMRFWIRRGVKSKRKSPFVYKRRCKALNDKPVLIIGPAGKKIKGSLIRKIRLGSKTIKGWLWRDGKNLMIESAQIGVGQDKLMKRLLCAATTKYNVRIPAKYIQIIRPGEKKNAPSKEKTEPEISKREMGEILAETLIAVDEAEESELHLKDLLSDMSELSALADQLTQGEWSRELAEEPDDISEDESESSEEESSEEEPVNNRIATIQSAAANEKATINGTARKASIQIQKKLEKRTKEAKALEASLQSLKKEASEAAQSAERERDESLSKSQVLQQRKITIRMTDDHGDLIGLAVEWEVSKSIAKKIQVARNDDEAKGLLLDWIESQHSNLKERQAQLDRQSLIKDAKAQQAVSLTLAMSANLAKGRKKDAKLKREASEQNLNSGVSNHNAQMEILAELTTQLPPKALNGPLGEHLKALQIDDVDDWHAKVLQQRNIYREKQAERRQKRHTHTQDGNLERLNDRTLELKKDVHDMLNAVNDCDNGFRSALAQVKSHRSFLKDELQDFIREHPEFSDLGNLIAQVTEAIDDAEDDIQKSIDQLAEADSKESMAEDSEAYHANLHSVTMNLLQDRKLDKPSQMLHSTDPIDDLRQVNHRLHERIQTSLAVNPSLHALLCELIRRIHDLEAFIHQKELEGESIEMAEDTDKDGALGQLWENLPSAADPAKFNAEIAKWKSIEAYFWWRLGAPLETKLR